jgi:hypothetical protein
MDPLYPDTAIVPDADAICQAIFAGTVALGRPDPFLARELADGALHFIALDGDAASVDAVRETVIKVVRELGHPRLAQAIDAAPDSRNWEGYWTTPNQPTALGVDIGATATAPNEVYPSNLMAAHHSGLLTLCDLDLPDKMIGGLLERPRDRVGHVDWTRRLFDARQWLGRFVALDGAEYYPGAATSEQWLDAMAIGLRATELTAVINLNTGPSDDDVRSLFSPRQPSFWESDELQPAWDILDAGLSSAELPTTVQWRWHLSARDFEPDRQPMLARLAGMAIQHPGFCFVFDRPNCMVLLGNGIDRHTSSISQRAEISLSALLKYLPTDVGADLFIEKSGSLARLALSAGHAKRAFLRTHGVPDVRIAFRSERSVQLLTVRDWTSVADHFFPGTTADHAERAAFQVALHQQFVSVITADHDGKSARLRIPERTAVCQLGQHIAIDTQLQSIAVSKAQEVSVRAADMASAGDRLASILELLWLATSAVQVRFEIVS